MTVFDPGLQPERTELAWRRTALALGGASLIAVRLLPAVLGSPWWALIGLAGLLASGVLWGGARRRYRRIDAALAGRGSLPGGALLAMLAVCVFAAGLAGFVVVLVR